MLYVSWLYIYSLSVRGGFASPTLQLKQSQCLIVWPIMFIKFLWITRLKALIPSSCQRASIGWQNWLSIFYLLLANGDFTTSLWVWLCILNNLCYRIIPYLQVFAVKDFHSLKLSVILLGRGIPLFHHLALEMLAVICLCNPLPSSGHTLS